MVAPSHSTGVVQGRNVLDAQGILGAMAEVDERGGDVVTSNLEILDALEQQVTCYRRLARLAEAQREHVQQSHMEALLEVLKNRQEILDQLARLESVITPAKRRWPDFLGEIESDARGRAEEMVAETRRL